ncbi:unnamed protein product [Mucor hiemalis]
MPMSMISTYSEITEKELGVLERQFEKSHFNLHKSTSTPKKLAIFDFDSTLFFSPFESVYGPGWWRDIRSLDIGPFEELQKNAWEGYWNEKIVQEARDCIEDPNTMTVVLTGRRHHPFHQLIPYMLEAKNLHFDLIGLRPDPESVSEKHWEAQNAKVSYNLTSSVFKWTMHFKTCFMLNILHCIPSIQSVTMWDDRFHHVKRFQEFLDVVKNAGTIKEGNVIYVPGIRPVYNPNWEKEVVAHIIETHNQALLEHEKGERHGTMKQRLEWKAKPEDPLASGSKYFLELTPAPAQTVVSLTPECTQQLKESYHTLFDTQSKQLRRTKWKSYGGEQPSYFGDNVYLSQKVIPSGKIVPGPIGTQVNITITGYSHSPRFHALLLQVQVEGDDENKHVLPLWYKPSEFNDLFRPREYIYWKSIRPTDRKLLTKITGKINYAYRLSVSEKTSMKRTHDTLEDDDDSSSSNTRARH